MAVTVQAIFSEEVKLQFREFVKKNIDERYLYFSPDPRGAHIQGDMSSKLHLTLYYGLPKTALHNEDLPLIIEDHFLEEIELGDLNFLDGYQNLYKIFSIDVKDDNGKLKELCEKISYFAWEDTYTARFKPRITIAYVTNDFELPKNTAGIPKKIEIETIEITEKY
jgi:hypothetical protein